MPKLPVLSGNKLIKILEKYGYHVKRQRGSHVRLVHTNSQFKKITVPLHKEIGAGLLFKIVKDANLTPEEFLKLLR